MTDLSSYQVTPEQKAVLREILLWLAKPQSPSLILGGYAGTGKTTLIATLRALIKVKKPTWRVAFAAYTGKASQVLAEKLRTMGSKYPKDSVSTLHSLLYAPITKNEEVIGWQRKDEVPFQLIIVDEASMVTRDIWKDVLSFGVPVLAVGDHGQLPPIGENSHLMDNPDLLLETIHRQAAESPIIQVANFARTQGHIPVGSYGSVVKKIDMQSSDAQLMLEDFAQTYTSSTLFLTGFNHSRQRLNQTIRAAHWRNPEGPEIGDTVICLKNNWSKGIFNGMMGKIATLGEKSVYQEQTMIEMGVQDPDSGTQLYKGAVFLNPFEKDGQPLPPRLSRDVAVFDYGYALTVHKAQGSQAKRVIVLEERSRHTSDDDWKRWLYTAVTRAEEELYVFGSP